VFPVTECRIKNGHVILRTAIGEENDPPQNPCEPYLIIAPGLFKETLHHSGVCRFHPMKSGELTICLIGNYPYIIRQSAPP
jgi:hypothetical protein